MALLELLVLWSYQYALRKVLSFTVDGVGLEEEEKESKKSVDEKIRKLEEAIKLDLEKDEKEAEKAFRMSAQWRVSDGKDAVQVPDCSHKVREGKGGSKEAPVEASETSSLPPQQRGLVSSLSSWFSQPKTKTE